MLVCVSLMVVYSSRETPRQNPDMSWERSAEISRLLAPIAYQTEIVGGVTTFWKNLDSPKGILFMFHGCKHSGDHLFLLPEGKLLIQAILSRHLVPVAFTSQQQKGSKCWDPLGYFPGGDMKLIPSAIRTMVEQNRWNSAPKYLFGISSGAEMASVMPITMIGTQFAGIINSINTGPWEVSVIYGSGQF